jgi:hypothetical protein
MYHISFFARKLKVDPISNSMQIYPFIQHDIQFFDPWDIHCDLLQQTERNPCRHLMCLPKLTQLLCPYACWLHSLGRLAVFQSISLVHTPLDPGPKITCLVAVIDKHFFFLSQSGYNKHAQCAGNIRVQRF